MVTSPLCFAICRTAQQAQGNNLKLQRKSTAESNYGATDVYFSRTDVVCLRKGCNSLPGTGRTKIQSYKIRSARHGATPKLYCQYHGKDAPAADILDRVQIRDEMN